jgi:hypothetical protein
MTSKNITANPEHQQLAGKESFNQKSLNLKRLF